MKKIFFVVTLLASVTLFGQKDELKTLDRTFNLDSAPSQKDIDKVKTALSSLDGMVNNLTPEEKNDYNFYKGVEPLMDFFAIVMKNPNDKAGIENALSYNKMLVTSEYFNKVLDFEKGLPKKVHSDEINEDIIPFILPMMSQKAYALNGVSKFKEASDFFYLAYLFDKKQGTNLENAAVLAVQAEDYSKAEKLYEEYKKSDYLNNGIVYFATNKLTEKEEELPSQKDRADRIKLGTYEKPRDEKVALKKPNVYKVYAVLVAQNGDIDKAKAAYKEAKELNPDDVELLTNEANLYYKSNDLETYSKLINEIVKKDPTNASLHFNIGYLALADDVKIVEEINKSLDNRAKYDELIAKRKAMFNKALPFFEESYKLDPSSVDTKQILKMTYEVLGMKEKADKL